MFRLTTGCRKGIMVLDIDNSIVTGASVMKYMGMPAGMWLLFAAPFRRSLAANCGGSRAAMGEIARRAKVKYREIIGRLPEFEKGDRFRMNIVSCAMLSAFLLSMDEKPTTEQAEAFYNEGMMIGAMRWFCRMSGKRKF